MTGRAHGQDEANPAPYSRGQDGAAFPSWETFVYALLHGIQTVISNNSHFFSRQVMWRLLSSLKELEV